MEFLLTGFSQQKEKEIEGLIRKYGGMALSQIPSTNLKGKRSSRFQSRVLPVVLCLKKVSANLSVFSIFSLYSIHTLFLCTNLCPVVRIIWCPSNTEKRR